MGIVIKLLIHIDNIIKPKIISIDQLILIKSINE